MNLKTYVEGPEHNYSEVSSLFLSRHGTKSDN